MIRHQQNVLQNCRCSRTKMSSNRTEKHVMTMRYRIRMRKSDADCAEQRSIFTLISILGASSTFVRRSFFLFLIGFVAHQHCCAPNQQLYSPATAPYGPGATDDVVGEVYFALNTFGRFCPHNNSLFLGQKTQPSRHHRNLN